MIFPPFLCNAKPFLESLPLNSANIQNSFLTIEKCLLNRWQTLSRLWVISFCVLKSSFLTLAIFPLINVKCHYQDMLERIVEQTTFPQVPAAQ